MGETSAQEPLVSVIVPTRNRPGYLREALASAMAQTYSNFEILVRDNASDPATAEVVKEFSDPRIQYVRHDFNIGPTRNVIEACRAAAGKYVTTLHDDDVWEPTFLEKMIPPLEADPELAIGFCDHWIINADGTINASLTRRNTRQWKRHSLAPGKHQPIHALAVVHKTIPLSMAAVMRRDVIDWDDVPDLPSCYDIWLMYLVSRDGQAAFYVPERLTRYRVHNGSETSLGRIRLDQAFLMCCERMLSDERMRSVWPELNLACSAARADLGFLLVRQGRAPEGRRYLRRALQMHCSPRALLLYGLSFLPLPRYGRQANGAAPANGPAPTVLAIAPGARQPASCPRDA